MWISAEVGRLIALGIATAFGFVMGYMFGADNHQVEAIREAINSPLSKGNTEWLDVLIDGEIVEINGAGQIRRKKK